jgi:aspartate-semialdehyde dehydrogenase
MDMTRLGLLGIAGKISTAYIGQKALLIYQNHPLFEVAGFIADDPADAGKTLGEVLQDRWQAEEPLPAKYADKTFLPADTAVLKKAGLDLVLSTLAGPKARELDPVVAAAGIAVVSESVGNRLDPDVPLIVPDINADHLAAIPAQQKARGFDRGFIVSAPVCTAVIVALAMKPFIDAYGLKACVCTTLQALSGAGKTGVTSLQILDNVLTFIKLEEDKLHTEVPKILGSCKDGVLAPHPGPFTFTATRVAVTDGHTASISLGLEKTPDLDQVNELIDGYRGRAQELSLPQALEQPLVYRPEIDRPQPLLDRDRDNKMAVSIGRVRPADAFENGMGIIAVGHNHGRGTYGNAVLLTELLVKEGLVG